MLVRCGMAGFGGSSLDYALEFDVKSEVWQKVFDARHEVLVALLERFNEEGIEFAYPTQTSFTAAPDGTMIMPYPEVQAVKRMDLRDDEASGPHPHQSQRHAIRAAVPAPAAQAGAEALRAGEADQREAERPAELAPDGRAARGDRPPCRSAPCTSSARSGSLPAKAAASASGRRPVAGVERIGMIREAGRHRREDQPAGSDDLLAGRGSPRRGPGHAPARWRSAGCGSPAPSGPRGPPGP